MFDYNICTEADEKIFNKQCKALEKNIPGLKKGELLIDVDSSKIQEYFLYKQRLTVHNSYYIGAVYIKSEFDIDRFFTKTTS